MKVIRPIRDEIEAAMPTTGEGIGFLSSDPNVLVQKLSMLMSSHKAGNTGVFNEICAILDELLRQKLITMHKYKSIYKNLKNGIYAPHSEQ